MSGVTASAGYALALWSVLAAALSAQTTRTQLESYLRSVGVESKQLEVAAGGRGVVTLLSTKNDRDVAVFGMIGVRARQDAVVAYFSDPLRWLPADGRRFRVFSTPPTAEDLAGVGFATSEYRDLKGCRAGDCDFKLPASAMKKLAREIDWSEPDAKARADQLLRDDMLRLVTDYLSSGNAATLVYDDVHGVRAGDVFGELMAQTPHVFGLVPELQRFLMNYPSDRIDGTQDFMYWSEDRLPRVRPTLTLHHVVGYALPTPMTRVFVLASKQIYANHYFEGALDHLAVVEFSAPIDGATTFLLSIRRFRFDNLPRGLLNIRGRVRSRMLSLTRSDLERHRSAVETPRS
jgi:hypothetical protein